MKENSALLNALLACEIAGVGLNPPEDLARTEALDGPPDSFVLESELSERVTLRIEFEAEHLEFRVKSSVTPPEGELTRAITLALSLNQPAADSDRFALDLESSTITFTRRLADAETELAELAFAVRTATEVGLALSEAQFPEILTETGGSGIEFASGEGVVRG